MNDRLLKFSLGFSVLALALSVMTFVKTGGVNDIKRQITIIRNDLNKAREQSEERMANRSTLFDAIYDLTDSVDSLQSGNEVSCRILIDKAIAKIESVEPRLEEKKRNQLANLRKDIEKSASSLKEGNAKGIRDFEYQIRMLRIFEENL